MFGLIENPTSLAIAAVALVLNFLVYVIALRGTRPDQRAEIIRALRSQRWYLRSRDSLDL